MNCPADREDLRAGLQALGFDVVRFARIEGAAPGAGALRRWLADGMQGGMEWLVRNADRRCTPDLVLPGAATMVVLGVNYAPAEGLQGGAAGRPRWARYSLYQDYHDTMTPALALAGRLLEERLGIGPTDHRYYVDTGPVLERSWAAKAGLGFTGKNAMLISRDFGNWLFLAAILVRAEIEPDEPLRGAAQTGVGALCGSCTRCLTACPTAALTQPGVVDARRCISYLTIENKGPIPEEFRPLIGDRIYGCDICAEVCPWNRFAREARSVLLVARSQFAQLDLASILKLDTASFAEVFRGTPVKRIKRAGLLRNACVVAGNSGDRSLVPLLEKLASEAEESVLVREHAAWALGRLG
jgi:epoxyqueuosine reductase